MNSFTVTTKEFEGPIDALLKLIERRKLPINDISLAEITDEYIRFVQSLDEESIANKTHFIFIASTLTLIKSKSLLPTLELNEEEEDNIEELKYRLSLLQVYAESAEELKKRFYSRPQFYHATAPKKIVRFDPGPGVGITSLHEALVSVLNEVPDIGPKKKEATIRIAVHIEEMMHSLEKRIRSVISTDFNSFIGGYLNNKNKKEIVVYKVVGFLAMLEMVKNGALHVTQEQNFKNIHIENV